MEKQELCHCFSLAAYLLNLAAIVLAYIFPVGGLYAAVLFPPVFVSFGLFIRHARARPPECVLKHIPSRIKVLAALAAVYVTGSFGYFSGVKSKGSNAR